MGFEEKGTVFPHKVSTGSQFCDCMLDKEYVTHSDDQSNITFFSKSVQCRRFRMEWAKIIHSIFLSGTI